ncbi:hypothetical protein BKA70DRAFT_1339685 [Coprinopsis sp. MPI-PUGE-AT-0042]|nr:hypothetical protein BKA70DRAFT_1339685 [Coprinopsis sp. MPI-PUGE-AT-0042]
MAEDVGTRDHDVPSELVPSQLSGPSSHGLTPGGWPITTPAPIPASGTIGLFQGGSSGNALNNSTANAAHGDIWNVGNMHIHLPDTSHVEQAPSSPPQQPVSIFSYILSTFTTLAAHTAVTLGSLQYGASYTMTPPNPLTTTPDLASAYRPDPTVLDSESVHVQVTDTISSQAAENMEEESGDFEITLLEDLDMSEKHQPKAWYRSPDLPNGLSFDGIYIRKIYPNGHGYPCPNPCPEGPPVRIGDVGELTSTGLTVLTNLADCGLPSLQSELPYLALSDPWHEADYFSEGQSITGGVSVDKVTWLPQSETIKDIKYRCHAPQGAVLAMGSPAQLHTLTRDKNRRLRDWLCKHGMDLVQLLDPGRIDPLYVVTGKVTSSSWATATYSEPMTAPDDALVLTRFFRGLPPYRWTEPGNSRNWSKSSSTMNPEGERASDQCLFLRGFLVTPSPTFTSRQERRALKTSNNIPGTGENYPTFETSGNGLGERSSDFTQPFQPSSQSRAPHERAGCSESDELLVEEVPSSSSVVVSQSPLISTANLC